MAWVQKLQLTSDDAVFAGEEAFLMQRAINGDHNRTLTQSVALECANTSLHKQAQLAIELRRQGCASESIAIAAGTCLDRFGEAGQAVLTSASLKKAIHILNAFAPLLNLRHHLALSFRGADAILTLHDLINLPAELDRLLRALDLAKVSRFLGDMFGCDGLPPGVEIDDVRIRMPAHLFSEPLPASSRTLHQAHQRACRNLMQGMEEAALCEGVRRLLVRHCDKLPSLAQTAAQLGFSTRTFRRRLAGHGTTFLQILDEVRYSLAIRYLATSRMTTEVIAQRLGYSESANFRHAFHRWTGSSPRRFWTAAWGAPGLVRETEACLIEMAA